MVTPYPFSLLFTLWWRGIVSVHSNGRTFPIYGRGLTKGSGILPSLLKADNIVCSIIISYITESLLIAYRKQLKKSISWHISTSSAFYQIFFFYNTYPLFFFIYFLFVNSFLVSFNLKFLVLLLSKSHTVV